MVRLIHGDCIEEFSRAEYRGVADLVFADPPFNLGKEFDESLSPAEYYAWCGRWIEVCAAMLKSTGSFFLMTIQEHVGRMMEFLGRTLKFKNQIVWLNSSMPHKDRFTIGYQPILYYSASDESTFNYGAQRRKNAVYLTHGRVRPDSAIKDIWDDITFLSGGCIAPEESILTPGRKRKLHPAQMPVALPMRAILHCTNGGGLVVDPFSGIGTTAVACLRAGRDFIGTEKRRDYFDAAQIRIKEEEATLFAEMR